MAVAIVATTNELTSACVTRWIGDRLAEPMEREAGRRPGLDAALD